jgi:hypothetical protein
MTNGKGSKRRPRSVSPTEEAAAWARTFGRLDAFTAKLRADADEYITKRRRLDELLRERRTLDGTPADPDTP